ncbi:putative membrane protein [Camellia lanceoleosa]|nr:putative membrane protein [Camellia lanceoleosa]
MGDSKGFLTYVCYFLSFLPVFLFLFVLGIIKGAIFSPFVFLVVAFGDAAVVFGLWPCHLVWSIYCIARTKKLGPWMKCLLIPTVPVPIALWTVVGVVGSVIMGIGYGFVWPVLETFRAISNEGISVPKKLVKCFTDGTWTTVWGACTIVRDFADFSFHSYFSLMDGLLKSKGEDPIELKIAQIPGCIFCAILGVMVDVPFVTVIVLYKTPIMLFKGWHRLVQDLIGREGPFLETVCVPFAGLLILLWPAAVILSTFAGIVSSFFFGCYAAVVAYQESSTKNGLLYVVASVSLFDEYTNDFLYLQEGSCFPRPNYRDEATTSSSLLPVKGLHQQLNSFRNKEPLSRISSEKKKTLSAVVIWNNFIKACEYIGKELLRDEVIGISDLEAWQHSKTKIFNIGIPAYVFLECFLRSIKSGSPGFVMRDNSELTSLNRPEGRVFDWMFEPMSVMKEQLKSLNLTETEELYLYKFCLYSGDMVRIQAWQNGGFPPQDDIRRAQLEGLSRRLQGFCLTVSRLPTCRRRFSEVVKELEHESKQRRSDKFDVGADSEATAA